MTLEYVPPFVVGEAWDLDDLYADRVAAGTVAQRDGIATADLVDGALFRVEDEGATEHGAFYRYDSSADTWSLFPPQFGDVDVTGDITVSGTVDGTDISVHVADVDAHHAKYTNEEAQDAVGTNVTSGLAYDDAAPSYGLDVVLSGQVTLSSGTAVVDTTLSATDATFHLALGIDDPNADVKVAGRLFWDDSAGTYKIEIVESDTSVGNPTVNYDVVRVR